MEPPQRVLPPGLGYAQMYAFSVLVEHRDELDTPLAVGAEPVRNIGIEFGCFASRQHKILLAKEQPQLSAEHVKPLVPLVATHHGSF